MSRYPKRLRSAHEPLAMTGDDVIAYTGVLWRIHRTQGDHVIGWDRLREWGPAANCRWEPHPTPTGDHPSDGVMYAATDLATAVVETFQSTRRIDPVSGSPRATSWTPVRPLRLLNLTDDWWLRNGASAALTSAPHAVCQNWARAVRVAFPRLDGLWSGSVLTGRPNVTLWAPAAETFPVLPDFSEPLIDDLIWDRLDRIAHRYRDAGYRMI